MPLPPSLLPLLLFFFLLPPPLLSEDPTQGIIEGQILPFRNIVPGKAKWLGDFGEGDGTPDIGDYLPLTYTVFGVGGEAINRIVLGLSKECPAVMKAPSFPSILPFVLPEVKLRVEGTFSLPRAFPVKVCEVRLKTNDQKEAWSKGMIYFNNTNPSSNIVIPTDPRKILIYGDTGLRVKAKSVGLGKCERSPFELYNIKQCPTNFTEADLDFTTVEGSFQSLDDWHFDDMASFIASKHQDIDMAVHVGDYIYRESPCPTQLDGNGNCLGINGPTTFRLPELNQTLINFLPGNWGDNLLGWWADFLYPARELLQKVPFIAVRGNHEVCSRAGFGFFFFLDAGEYDNSRRGAQYCKDHIEPFAVPFKREQFLVQDTANLDPAGGGVDDFNFVPDACPGAPEDGSVIEVEGVNRYDYPDQDREEIKEQVELFKSDLVKMKKLGEGFGTNMIVTHRPYLATACNNTRMVALDWTLQQGITRSLLSNVSAIIAGHVHWLEVVEFTEFSLPTQIIVGHGSTKLIPNYVNQTVFPFLEFRIGKNEEIVARVERGFSNSSSYGFGMMVRNIFGEYDTSFYQYSVEKNNVEKIDFPVVVPRTRGNDFETDEEGESDFVPYEPNRDNSGGVVGVGSMVIVMVVFINALL